MAEPFPVGCSDSLSLFTMGFLLGLEEGLFRDYYYYYYMLSIVDCLVCSVVLTNGPLYFHLIVLTFYPHLLLPVLREPRAWGNLPVRGPRATTAASCHCHLIPRDQYYPAKAAALSSNLPAPFPVFKLKAGRQGLMKFFCLGDIPWRPAW